MKKATALTLALMLLTGLLAGCGSGAADVSALVTGSEKPAAAEAEAEVVPALQLPDQEIKTIQIDGFKFHHEFSGGKGFDRFAESLEAVAPIREDEVQVGNLGHVVTLTFEDETKERFQFIQAEADDSVWYVETEDGTVYQNAEFITEYIAGSPWTEDSGIPTGAGIAINDPDGLREMIQLRLELEEMGLSYSTTDLRAAFAMEMLEQRSLFADEEAALEMARTELAADLQRYQYAVEHGYGLSEEELDLRIAEWNDMLTASPDFEVLEACYAEQGTTFDAMRGAQREADRIRFVNRNLYDEVCKTFRRGNDRIGDRVCENTEEYWLYYQLDVIAPATEDYSEETLAPLLDEAEAFYREQFSQVES